MLSSQIIESSLSREQAVGRVYVAFSGGVDSHVLLHLCAGTPSLSGKITAVYVHHGLQAAAGGWPAHCRGIAEALAVEFVVLRVNATADVGQSPEEAARNARYTAFKALLKASDVLLVAQHREDQLETVLLQLFRGSGLAGLSGMPERMPFGEGVMLRPLLNIPKQAITEYAQDQQLKWVEDPSNQSSDFDRNYLRNQVLPLLKQRWPAVDKTVSRSAGLCAEAQTLVNGVAEQLFASVFGQADRTLIIDKLNQELLAHQRLIIRQWFSRLGLKMPAQAIVERILLEVVGAKEQGDPVLMTQGYEIRRYRDKLYALPKMAIEICEPRIWPTSESSVVLGNGHSLAWVEAKTGIALERLQAAKVEVKFRHGGEKISLPGRAGRHILKKLFQEAGIPSWERTRMPLVYINGVLAAVGEHWVSSEFYTDSSFSCVRLRWQR